MRRTFALLVPTLLLVLAIHILLFLLPWVSFLLPRDVAIAAAPITPSGLNTQVSQPVTLPSGQTQYNITGGTRPGGGTNLFHSFGDFNVPNKNIANFLNDSGLATSNILGRVTGGNLSNIFGTIQTTGYGNANLFLMNPAGFLFGPNATVNVGGMVSFTSADYLRLADGKLFNAVPNPTTDALLSTAPVAAYGFLGSNPGAITVQGSQLTVAPGQSLSLVGGNITINSGKLDDGTVQTAKLSAQGGQINLASVASPGEILAGTFAQAPNINGQSFDALGTIQVLEQSTIDASGNGGGTVLIRGGNLLLDNSTISANVTGPGPVLNGAESIGTGIEVQVSKNAVIQNGAIIETNVLGNATPGVTYGGIHINANRIEVNGILDLDSGNIVSTSIHSNVDAASTGGNSGDIKLEANSILVKDFGDLTSQTDGSGNAGNIVVKTTGNLEIDNLSVITTGTSAQGNAGNIELTSTQGDVLLINGASVTSQSVFSSTGTVGSISVFASSGNILLTGNNLVSFPASLFTSIQGTGPNAGKGGIQLNAKNLTIENSSIEIDNLTSFEPGGLTVNLTGTLRMSGGDILNSQLLTNTRRSARSADLNVTAHDVLLTDGSQVATETFRSGDAGTLNIFTESLQITNGAQVRSSSRFNPLPPPGPPVVPSGAAGIVTVQGLAGPTQSVLIDGHGGGIFTNTEGTGAGGSMNISAQSLTVQNGGTLSAASSGTAPSASGGTILVKADTVNLNTSGTMTATSTGAGAAGQVTVQGLASPAQSVTIDGVGSGIFTDTHSTGLGGNVSVNANTVTLQNGGTLSAATSGTTSSATGGDITINANQVQVNSGGLITAATTGAGPGGSVNINAGNSFSSDVGTVSSTASQANGGNINIAAANSVTLTNGASVSASSTGTGNAGSIQINAGNQFAMTNSTVTTEANQSGGGIIKITTNPNGTVQLTDSTISASVLEGNGGGGSVNIDPQSVVLINSQILAQAVQGPGGNINITTNLLLPDSTSVISASSQFGQQGTIIIQSPISPASGKIVPLGQKPLLATTLLSQRCAAIAGGNISSFTVAGRDSLPAEPAGWVSSPLALNMVGSNEGAAAETAFSSYIEMAEGAPLLSLRRIAPPGFLTQSFAPNGSTDCTTDG